MYGHTFEGICTCGQIVIGALIEHLASSHEVEHTAQSTVANFCPDVIAVSTLKNPVLHPADIDLQDRL